MCSDQLQFILIYVVNMLKLKLRHGKYSETQQAQTWASLSINFPSDQTLWYKSVPFYPFFFVQFCLEDNFKTFKGTNTVKIQKLRSPKKRVKIPVQIYADAVKNLWYPGFRNSRNLDPCMGGRKSTWLTCDDELSVPNAAAPSLTISHKPVNVDMELLTACDRSSCVPPTPRKKK